jgi:hypothetical protein
VGVHAAARGEVPQWRALHRPCRQGHHRLCARSREQESLRHVVVLEARQGGAGRQRPHRALRHRQAVPEPDRSRLAHRPARVAAQGSEGAGPAEAGRASHRHGAVQVRGVAP